MFSLSVDKRLFLIHYRECGRMPLSVGCDIQSSYLGVDLGVCACKGDNCNTSAYVSASGVITVIALSIISVIVNEP